MKRLLLTSSFLALLAAPSFAYVQSGQLLPADPKSTAVDARVKVRRWLDPNPVSAPNVEPIFDPLVEGVTRPIPEPGTMILASLGLLALGVSRSKRRGH